MKTGADSGAAKPNGDSVVISSRVRLARNLAGERFVNSADSQTLRRVYEVCVRALGAARRLKAGTLYRIDELSQSERMELFEERKISSDLLSADVSPRGLYLSADGMSGAMINEEDHLRIFVVGRRLCPASLWRAANALDDDIERGVEYAYSPKYGYLTACPTNVGTGIRVSVMMHLPALEMLSDMEKIVRGVNQLGMTFRGGYGEGSGSPGAFYQLSNQQTLGISEGEIVAKISKYAKKIREFELDARARLREDSPLLLADKILRAHAMLSVCRLIDTAEALGCLSSLRLAADMGMAKIPIETIDALMVSIQPAHLAKLSGLEGDSFDPVARDCARADFLRRAVGSFPPPAFPDSRKI